jgi:hypothetical protein
MTPMKYRMSQNTAVEKNHQHQYQQVSVTLAGEVPGGLQGVGHGWKFNVQKAKFNPQIPQIFAEFFELK